MNAYATLRREAAARRDAAIERAHVEYRATLKRIAALARSAEPPRATMGDDRPFCELTTIAAAERILRDGKARTVAELVVLIQGRGCRSDDPPRKVANTLRMSLNCHRGRFWRDGAGKWAAC